MQPINHATTLGNDMIEIYTSMPGFILSIHSHTIEPVQRHNCCGLVPATYLGHQKATARPI